MCWPKYELKKPFNGQRARLIGDGAWPNYAHLFCIGFTVSFQEKAARTILKKFRRVTPVIYFIALTIVALTIALSLAVARDRRRRK